MPEFARVEVPEGSPEWLRVLGKLHKTLPQAILVKLERVQNHASWSVFCKAMYAYRKEGGCIDFTREGSGVQELWHVTSATDIICKSPIGFDVAFAEKNTRIQKIKDMFGVGGHVYGYGNYFALCALYSYFWATRYWFKNRDRTQHQVILARVLTGKSKDYGREWNNQLRSAPAGYDSVSGTESDQQVAPVKVPAGLGDTMAQELLKRGGLYGRQFVVFKNSQVVTLTLTLTNVLIP